VSLIDLLADKNPILIAGDDDQALYEPLKSANPKHIRQRHSDKTFGYCKFDLPYCSRCTRVIVDAVNDIIVAAHRNDYLKDRICKPFIYFEDSDKDRDSERNPFIIYTQTYDRQIPWMINKMVQDIASEERCKFSVLIISPTRTKSLSIVRALKKKGFKNVSFTEKNDEKEPTLFDGLELLLKNRWCNLGWRIAAKKLLQNTDFEAALIKSHKEGALKFSRLVKDDIKGEVFQLLKTLRAVRDGKKTIEEADFVELLRKIEFDVYGMAKEHLKEEIQSASEFHKRSG